MFKFRRIGWLVRSGVWVAALLVPAILLAADAPKRSRNRAKFEGEKIDIFAGIEKGQLEVTLIPKDEKKSQLLIKNMTDKPLSVQMPPAFAGVPVLAQGIMGGDFMQNQPQPIGGGPGGGNAFPNFMNIGNAGGGNNGFFNLKQPAFQFNIAPEKVGKLRLTTVCLDHDKKTPRPQIKYELKPIKEVAKKPGVAQICAMLGNGSINQRVAQLAAWHLENDKTWNELKAHSHRGAFNRIPHYSNAEIRAAQQLVEKVAKTAKSDESSKSSKDQ